jgi:DNA gyrase subunit B
MDVAVARDGAMHTISFQRGVPGVFDKATPDSKFTASKGNKNLKKGGKVGKKASGTTIKYWSDPQIFLREADYDIEEIHARARQTAFLVPGISEYCTYLQPETPICDVIRLKGSGHYQETVPVLDDQGHLVPTDVERDMEVDIALRWGDGYDGTIRSFVNIISTGKGGTHVTGFERGITKVVSDTLKPVIPTLLKMMLWKASPRWSRCECLNRNLKDRPKRFSARPQQQKSCRALLTLSSLGISTHVVQKRNRA